MKSGWIQLGILTTALGVAAALPSCGGDDDDDTPTGGSGGSGAGAGGAASGSGGALAGTGGSATAGTGGKSEAVPCGAVVCMPTSIPLGPMIPACCFDAPSGRCGVDTSLLSGFGVMPTQPCEPLDQPGEPDATCPNSEPVMVGTTNLPAFQGCCREETGQCGYLIDKVGGLVPIGLGCVDSAPFLDGGTPTACGSGGGGEGGGG